MNFHLPVFVFATFAITWAGHAQEPPSVQEPFTTLFALTCMQHYYSPNKLGEQMEADGAAEVPPQNAEFFLGGKTGKAWIVLEQESRYVISLRDDGICAVFAQKANDVEAHKNFASLVSTAPTPMLSEKRETNAPDSGDARSASYAWFRPKDKSELLFTLTTTSSETATVQAMASMGLAMRTD